VDRRATSIAVGAVFAANGIVVGGWTVRIAEIQLDQGLSDAGLGVALVAVGAGALLAMPVAGELATRIGSARCIRALIVLVAIAPAAAALAPSVPLMMLGLALLGAGNGGLDVTMNTQAVALEAGREKPVMSTLHSLYSFGYLASALCGGLLAEAGVSIALHLALTGALALVVVLGTSRALIADRPGADAVVGLRWPTRALLVLGAISFFALLTEGAIADWGSVYITRTLESSPALAGVAFAAFGGGMAISRFAGDRLRVLLGPVRLVALGAGTTAAVLTLALIADSPLAVVPCFALVGLGLGNAFPVALAAAGKVPAAMSSGAAVASVSTVGYLGFLLGPAMIGFIAGAASLSLALGLLVVACGLIVVLSRAVGAAGRGAA
jgi:MFS family permease